MQQNNTICIGSKICISETFFFFFLNTKLKVKREKNLLQNVAFLLYTCKKVFPSECV